MSDRLRGKVALVTGGTSGIGSATAERFVREAARVVVVGRDERAGDLLVRRLGPACTFIKADLTIEADVSRAIGEAHAWGGGLDILFNNAGGLTHGTLDSFTTEDFQYAMNLVLGSVLYGIKHAAPIMKAQGSGAIINNSSVAAIRTHLGGYLYSIAKAGVTHATRLAGMELGRFGITVNCISPGAVATPLYLGGSRMASHMSADRAAVAMQDLEVGLSAATPMARAGHPRDIAAAATFLASDEGRYVNCLDLVVDGGLTAGARWSFDPDERFDPFGGLRRTGRPGAQVPA